MAEDTEDTGENSSDQDEDTEDTGKNSSDQDEVTKFVDVHREVAEEALSSGFGIVSTPGKAGDSGNKKDE
jgi:hypothetical protein